jgi:integrase
MLTVMEFALTSARRESEICRLEWRDNDPRVRTGMVRDAKHPTKKEGNHRRFKYTPEAWAVVLTQARSSEFIFPYNPKSVGAAFTRACKFLGITDLRFHDLRHEATSRLFERGYQIHEVAQFTLHDSWNELKRYANLKPENLRNLEAPAALNASPRHSRVVELPTSQPDLFGDRSAPRGRSH